MRRVEGGWVRVARDRADRRGRYKVVLDRPADEKWVVRAFSGGVRSGRRTVSPAPPPLKGPPADACGARVPKSDGTWWECSFFDEFAGSALNDNKWLAQETAVSGVANGTSCYLKKPWTIGVANGLLRLSAQKLGTPFTCKSPLADFTTDRASATVTTRGRFSQAYGRFSFRAQMSTTRVPGAHSALWLYPNKHTYGKWPLSGEVDVAEWYSALPTRVFPSVHYIDGGNNVHTGQDATFVNVSQWHTYTVEWSPTTMTFWFDGVKVYEHSWLALAPLLGSQPFDQPFNVVLTQAWGGLWNAPTALTPNRVTMTVDWVRVWR
ncbi:glycoside hydrolase family 16 protein [Nocardioides stalactiti]|uniref:glycoside hydrolase family 16 protein n=1 Tax=Nocardioides stalactiti TaxID=2755356 RepID=UPI0016011AD7|nr:glycoside hydrolase family 16 protein [Nocardioides stalactiti]